MNVRNSERGDINVLLVPLITTAILLVVSLGFGLWAFIGRQDYKDNSDDKVQAAVAVAVDKTKSDKDNEFSEREKEPYKDYTGPTQFGSITLKYPKTWSVYEKLDSNFVLMMQPDVVSAGNNTAYSLKVEVLNTEYSKAIAQSDSLVKQEKLTASPFVFDRVKSVVGLRYDGQIESSKQGSVIYMPLRDKTIKISAESEDRIDDFDNIILPNLSFEP